MEQLGEKIRRLREAQDWSIDLLAEKTGDLTSDHLGRIERGEAQNPGIQTLNRIAGALGVELKDLLDDSAA